MAERGARTEGSTKHDLLISSVGVVAFATGIVLAAWRVSQEPGWLDRHLVFFLVAGGAAIVTASAFIAWVLRRVRALAEDVDPLLARVRGIRKELGVSEVYQSIHHLFNDREILRPRGGGNVDMILDAADLPTDLGAYLTEIERTGARARVLFLDPSSALMERHRFATQEDGASAASIQHLRSKMQKAIDETRTLATVRLFDATAPGNLVIVDDHVFWGGLPGVPTDISLPMVGLTTDTREHVYWSFRRNFDALWQQAKPVDDDVERRTRAVAAASL